MLTYTLIGLLAFIAGLVFGRYLLPFPLWDRGSSLARRNRRQPANLNRFNFDKQKNTKKKAENFHFHINELSPAKRKAFDNHSATIDFYRRLAGYKCY